jgi:hypothetical protein
MGLAWGQNGRLKECIHKFGQGSTWRVAIYITWEIWKDNIMTDFREI